MTRNILLASPHMSKEGYEEIFVKEAFTSNWIAPVGENINQFEKKVSERIGSKGAIALSSGTAALHLALKAAGVKAGDIVFCSSLTFAASVNPISYLGAIPVFIGSEEKTWGMDPKVLKKAFQKYPECKAVIVVHLYGLVADLDPILEICDQHNAIVIEDAAEALGAKYKEKAVGSFGDYGIFSFNGNKIITTSSGGMIVSEDSEKLEKVRFWSTQSREVERHYEHKEIGYNYRMSNVLAGIGRGQLMVLDERIQQKRAIYQFYQKALADIEGIQFMPEINGIYATYWLSCVTFTDSKLPSKIIETLGNCGIEARPIWKPMHSQPIFNQYDSLGIEFDDWIFKHGVCLPSDTKMEELDLLLISKLIHEICRKESEGK